jgi:hypothetical protein
MSYRINARSAMSEYALRTENTLFGDDRPNILAVGDISTISIPDALRVGTAVRQDVASDSSLDRYGVPKYCIVPTEDLSDEIEKHPFAGGYGAENYNGLDYARGLALREFDLLAQLNGFSGYREQRSGEPSTVKDKTDTYSRLYDGFLMFDLDPYSGTEDGTPDSWEELTSRYGEEDAVVLAYMQKVRDVLRVNTQRVFRFLDPTPSFDFGVESDTVFERKMAIGRAMNNFLIERGHTPEASSVAVLSVDTGEVVRPTIDQQGNTTFIVDEQG